MAVAVAVAVSPRRVADLRFVVTWRAQHADRVRTLPAPPHCGHGSKPSAAGMDPWPTHLVHAADDQPASQDMAAASVLVHPAAHGIECRNVQPAPARNTSIGRPEFKP